MEQFNQTKSRAAVQEADRLAKKLVAAEAKIKELDEEADCLFDSREELVDEKRKQDLHIRLLKGELEVRKTYPRGVPPGPSPEQLRKQREAEEKKKREDAEWEEKRKKDFENSPMQLYWQGIWNSIGVGQHQPSCDANSWIAGKRKRSTQLVPCGSSATAANCL